MSRKSVIICTVFALLLLAGVGVLFYSLFKGDGRQRSYVPVTDAVEAVPSDAVLFYESGSLSDVRGLIDKGSALYDFVAGIPDIASDWETVVSLHYSSKNKVSPLLILSSPSAEESAYLENTLLDNCSGVINKKYGAELIYRSTVPDMAFTVYSDYLIASPSIVLVESSLRHISGGLSIKDDPDYSMAASVRNGDGVLHMNNKNLGKLFSGTVNSGFLKYAEFFRTFSRWMAFGISRDGHGIHAEGRCSAAGDGTGYSDVIASQEGGIPRIYEIAPYVSDYVLTLPLSSPEGFVSALSRYREACGMGVPGSDVTAWVRSMSLREAGVFSLRTDMASGRISALLTDAASRTALPSADSISAYPCKGRIASAFGKALSPDDESCYVTDGDWVLVGSRTALENYMDMRSSGIFFSLGNYLEQTPAAGDMDIPSAVSMALNMSRCRDSLLKVFRPEYAARLADISGSRNFEFVTLSIAPSGSSSAVAAFSFYSEDLAEQPLPQGAADTDIIFDETPVSVPEGPFRILNFVDGSDNYLEQLDNNYLRLLNSSRRSVWAIPFQGRLCGKVAQIDYFKNGKLQMLFASGNEVYLLDRLGRWVRPFPVSVGKEILIGPEVYDFKGDRNYVMMVLHADNSIGMYTLDGRPAEGWNEIITSERIMSLPELLECGGKRYWIVRTSYQTLIYNSEGILAADFSGRNRLGKDTPVEAVDGTGVAVTAASGKAMLLDLGTGVFRKR